MPMKVSGVVRVAVMINTQSVLLAVVAVGGLSAAAVAYDHKAPAAPVEVACLAVAPGVCLSGTVSWVAHAAAISDRPATVMMAMAGDDY